MQVTQPAIEGLKLIELKAYTDHRGFFLERFHSERFAKNGLPTQFVQDNHSRSIPRVLRGLHFQTDPAQGKLVGVIRGRIWDVAVDLRKDFPTFKKHYAAELTGENHRFLWIPAGFAHGFCVLGDEPADVLYKVDAVFNPKSDSGIHWQDPELAIPWPLKDPVLSEKDNALPTLAEYLKRHHGKIF